MECKTFRVKGHAEHDDPSKYVPKEIFQDWKIKDPVERYLNFLLENRILSMDDISKMEQEIDLKLEQSRKEALESPFPSPDEASKGVYEG